MNSALRAHLCAGMRERARCTYRGFSTMQALIGNGLVKQLRPAAKPFEVRDTRTKGFLLRVQPTGAMTYYAEYGRGKRMKLGRTDVLAPDRARQRARDIL